MKASRTWSVLILALILCGCWGANENTRVAGGDDIPNGLEPLGKKSAQARGDSAEWNGFKSMPRSGPGMYDTTTIPDSVPDTAGAGHPSPKGAAKRSAAPAGWADGLPGTAGGSGLLGPMDSLAPIDTLITSIKDTAKGTVEAVHTLVQDSTRRVDSTVFAPVDSAHPGPAQGILQVTGKITYADTGVWQAYRFSDADGDGVLTPHAGSLNRARVELSSKGSDGLIETRSLVVAAGKDLDFNARGDNQILASGWALVSAGDTLDWVRLLDADGDSLVMDFTKDTNVVDLVEERHLAQGNAKVTVTRTVRIVAFSKDSTRNYPERYRERTDYPDGGSLDIFAKGQGADSTFRPGLEAAWLSTRAYAAGDSLASRARTFRVRMAASPGAFSGDRLLAVSLTDLFRAGAYDRFDFDLTADSSVADGHWTATGAAQSSLSMRAGGGLSFDGQAVAGGLQGQVLTSSGISLPVFFDLQGVLIKQP